MLVPSSWKYCTVLVLEVRSILLSGVNLQVCALVNEIVENELPATRSNTGAILLDPPHTTI